ncbi:MAG: hypothetical protein A2959_03295 [Candidatus Levybacteria bacterium RIFCSPLOWO2_01_FULL_38_23]|nr:MAG: hypothetical protein A2959_03295 [Candidatus Levybacteria bacterium RIFCSPLOWO2_01_FULL_38_23]
MKMQAINLEFSLGNFNSFFDFKQLFEKIKKSFEKEQRDMLFHRRAKRQVQEYFDVMKFFFTSPDRI